MPSLLSLTSLLMSLPSPLPVPVTALLQLCLFDRVVGCLQGSARAPRWAMEPAPPPPRQQDAPSTVLERAVPPAMYHHLPYRTRHHRPYEPFDSALHHHGTRSNAHAPEHSRQERSSESVHRRSNREAPQPADTSLDVVPPSALPRRHLRRAPTNEELAERLADRRRREEARDAIFNAR